jgi:hypothetical protein
VCEAVVVTSGSFKRGGSRWPFDVKGEPVEPVRSTLDIECLTGSRKGMNDPEVTTTASTTTSLPMKKPSKLPVTPSRS